MNVLFRECTRPSACGEGNVFTRIWSPDTPPHAILQIAHGMQEHAGRYESVARFLAAHGWAVYANDHIGHGRSTMGHMGTFSLKPGGFSFLLEDMHTLFDFAAAEHPGLPKALLGHSMGSIASGLYATKYEDIDLLVLMGTPAPNCMAGAGALLAGIIARCKGPTAVSPLLTKLANANIGSGSSDDPMKRNAWLSRDTAEVLRAVQDPLFGKPFSASAYRELFRGLQAFGSRKWAPQVKNIPVLVIAGSADPCGKNGAGPRHYEEALRASGHTDVTLRLFDGARHEILHETNREEVEAALLQFLEEKRTRLQHSR